MSFKVGINGFGRIGRAIVRALAKNNFPLDIGLINELGDPATNAHLLQYDSVHGTFPGIISASKDGIAIDNRRIKMSQEKDPSRIPWKEYGVSVVLECTGLFTDQEKAGLHLKGGAKKVLISAPASNPDLTLAYGINHGDYDPARHTIISNASCTTNCLAPVAKVLHENFQIQYGLMTTIHSYTNDQRILDVAHKDLRRARAAAVSQIPTKTGAAQAVGLVLPELNGRIDGMAIRIPTPNVSCVDFVATVGKKASVSSVNLALQEASRHALKDILQYCDLPLVSSDFNGNPHSAIVDALLTKVIGDHMIKVIAWYDNEMGFSSRMVQVAQYIGERL